MESSDYSDTDFQEGLIPDIGEAMKVEDYLNSIDYSVDPFYVPSDFALEMVNFIKLVEGGNTENKTPVVHYKMLDNFIDPDLDTINLCHRGIAKALSTTTPLPTPSGWTTVGEVKVGDKVFSEDGSPATVLAKSEVFHKKMYRLILGDGRSLEVSEDHINTVIHRRQKRVEGKRVNYLDRRNLTTKELLGIPLFSARTKTSKNPNGKENRVWLPLPKPVEYSDKELPLDPYTLGVIIGDGAVDKNTGFCRLYGHVEELPHILKHIPTECGDIIIDKRFPNVARVSLLGLGPILKKLGLNCHGNDKRIPSDYLEGSINQRLSLLQGLMDTDGTVYKNGCASFTSNSFGLIEDIKKLVWSLGGLITVSSVGKAYRCSISLNMPLFRLERKAERQHFNCFDRVPLVAIEEIDQVPSQCLMVDSKERTFLAGDYVVTHNTTLKKYLMLYIGVYGELPGIGKIPYALYVSDSIDNGVKKMRRALELTWKNSEFLQKYIPQTIFTDIRWEFINSDGNSFVVGGNGAKTGVRGTHENNSRPVLALLDDLVSDDDARSATVISSIEDTIYKAIDYALHPKRRKIIWSGTPFNARDPMYKAVESGAWKVNVYPVCEKFPCSREEFRGSWEDRFGYDYVLKQYTKALKTNMVNTFNQELMLRIMSEEDRLILDSDIQWFKRDSVLNVIGNFNVYITTDFATSDKQAADFSVISVWAHSSNGGWFWIDGVCKRQTMDKNIDDLFRLAQRYKPLGVGIEVTGQQGGFIQWIQNEMVQRNIFFNLTSDKNNGAPGIRPSQNKMVRFNTAVPLFKGHLIYFPEEYRNHPAIIQAMDELTLVSPSGFKSKHDDFSDTVSMLPSMNAWRPSNEVNFSYQTTTDSEGTWVFESDDLDNPVLNNYLVG